MAARAARAVGQLAVLAGQDSGSASSRSLAWQLWPTAGGSGATTATAALRSLAVAHQLLVFEGEGHELLTTANRVAFVQATRQWVVDHL